MHSSNLSHGTGHERKGNVPSFRDGSMSRREREVIGRFYAVRSVLKYKSVEPI
jgi:hypothetical protein